MRPGPEALPRTAHIIEQGYRPARIGSDAHDPHRVGADFEAAIDTLGTVGYACTSIFLDRQRLDIPLDQARSALGSRSPAALDSPAP